MGDVPSPPIVDKRAGGVDTLYVTQEFRTQLEFLGLIPEKLGFSPFDTDAFTTKPALWLVGEVGEERIIWSDVDWSKADLDLMQKAVRYSLDDIKSDAEKIRQGDRSGITFEFLITFSLPRAAPTSNMLGAFTRIHSPDDVLRFARTYGPLELCRHGYPGDGTANRPLWGLYHKDNALCAGHIKNEELTRSAVAANLPVTFYEEKVSDWLRFVEVAKALLSLGLLNQATDDERVNATHAERVNATHAERVNKVGYWEAIFRDWYLTAEWRARASSFLGDNSRARDLTRIFVRQISSAWIGMGQIRPSLEWRGNQAKPSLNFSGNTFGHLGLQVAATLASVKNFRFCGGCVSLFPRMGRAVYCQGCQDKGVPAKNRKSRFRELHPKSDREYRLRKVTKKGDSNEQAR